MSNVLDEFLVLLGWKTDETGARKAETTSKRVSDSVVECERRATEAQVAGTAKRIIEADREAGRRTKGAAELIEAEKKKKAAQDKAAKEDEKRRKDHEAAETKAVKNTETARQSFLTGVAAMSAAASAAAVTVVAAFVKISSNLEQLYYASQRTKASAENLSAFGFAASQLGSSAAEAVSGIEALSAKMKASPGWEGQLNDLGIKTRDANGAWLDRVHIFGQMSDVLSKMPDHTAVAYGDAWGVPPPLLDAMRSGEMPKHMARYREMLAKAGLDEDKAAASSKRFMNTWRDLWGAVGITTTKVEAALVERFGASVERFTDLLLRNADRITDVAVKIGQFFGRLLDGTDRLIQGFNNLDPSTRQFLTWAAGIGAVLIFLGSSPLVALLAFGAGIVALYEDYRAWKDGSKDTLIDWDRWGPPIENALAALKDLWNRFDSLSKMLTGQDGLTLAFAAFAGVLALKVLSPLAGVVKLLGTLSATAPPPWLLKMLGIGAVAGYIAGDMLKNSTPEGRAGTITDAEAMINREQGGPSGYQRGWVGRGWDAAKRALGFGGGEQPGVGGGSAPRGDGAGTPGKAKTGQMMSWAMDQLRREGVPEVQLKQAAAHLVGQAHMESGLNPNLSHDNGTGYGIYGARDPGGPGPQRRTMMLQWLKANGYAPNSAEGQMRYMAKEAMSGRYRRTRDVLMGRGSGDLENDTNTITKEFEAPRIVNRRSGAVAEALRVGPTEVPPPNDAPQAGAKPEEAGAFPNGAPRVLKPNSMPDAPGETMGQADQRRKGAAAMQNFNDRYNNGVAPNVDLRKLGRAQRMTETTLPEQEVVADPKGGSFSRTMPMSPTWSDVAVDGLKKLGEAADKTANRFDHAFQGLDASPDMARRLGWSAEQIGRFQTKSLGTDPSQVSNSAKSVTIGDTNIKVEGVKDPHEAAKHTDTTLKRHRSDLIGNLGTALA